ncbi:TRAP transporter fused permease subunit [Ferrovibrio sp.]|uniref:TRAP transporter permease n=1 Tax=Ferrovibrio sp. TaxID=1917215 RepID=UPI00261BA207|nr:TRAP transporter fused permease subunit [Ferrovibrio sp.]
MSQGFGAPGAGQPPRELRPDSNSTAAPPPEERMVEELAYRRLSGILRVVFVLLTLGGIGLVLNQQFNLHLFGYTLVENRYLFLLAAATLPLVFLAYPWHPQAVRRGGIALGIDILLCLVCAGALLWFALKAELILGEGWEFSAPAMAKILGAVLWLLILEALRRTGGTAIFIIVTIVSLYPVLADRLPSPLNGIGQSLEDTLAYHIVSAESAFGIPMRAFGEIVIGFIVFGVALNHTGGGKFFNDVAFALVGRWRGGAAQVGVISSALQGSISGSVISNVISSGVVTIPAMKRTGFRADYAGGVEAVASTGAVLMPPVMGSTAFVMASFLGISYGEIALAAAVPALLFYFGLAMQIDAYSAKLGLRGLKAEELPSLWQTLKDGWLYIAVFAVLVWLMISEQQEAMAPFIATGMLLVINQILPKHRLTWQSLLELGMATGRALAELVAILAGVGFIIGAFSVTGLAGTLANDLVYLAGDKPIVLLLMGAITSFIFGMGMTVTACYIFLAIVLAPPLVKAGLDPLAVHLFIMYWGMISFITPPVALATFAAAPLARTSPFKIGFQAIRLGAVIYIVPFFFALNPALILKGEPAEVISVIVTAFVGVGLIAASIQGWLIGAGRLSGTPLHLLARIMLAVGGIALAAPGGNLIPVSNTTLAVIGGGLALGAFLLLKLTNRDTLTV